MKVEVVTLIFEVGKIGRRSNGLVKSENEETMPVAVTIPSHTAGGTSLSSTRCDVMLSRFCFLSKDKYPPSFATYSTPSPPLATNQMMDQMCKSTTFTSPVTPAVDSLSASGIHGGPGPWLKFCVPPSGRS